MCVNSVEFSTGEIKINTGVGRIQKKKNNYNDNKV